MPSEVPTTARYASDTALPQLALDQTEFIRHLAPRYRFTFQELKRLNDAALDLQMWGEGGLSQWWEQYDAAASGSSRDHKKRLLRQLDEWLRELAAAPKSYPLDGLPRPQNNNTRPVVRDSNKSIIGMCPVASEETVCCNLRTIDAVENCGMGCSYCAVQTFYDGDITFDSRFAEKLAAVELEPDRFYHIGTGQSSDSLMWGNQHGSLDTLCDFAQSHPGVLLEFKSKSKNVSHFLARPVPPNIVLSWSLNTPMISDNEEHFTATLEQRLSAARQVADRGIKVAFHFHPIVYYDTWRADYGEVARQVMGTFEPQEVLFLSFGTVTFIKPVIQAIRRHGHSTKMLQMEMVPGAKGKLSYPEKVKAELFSHLHQSFEAWHGEVFMYLCMEPASMWMSTFGSAYESNEAFEADFARQVQLKLGRSAGRSVSTTSQ